MLILRIIVGMLAGGVMMLNSVVVCGQDLSTSSGHVYPNKPIRVVTSPVGGGSDLIARFIAQGIASSLGQPMIADNRGGNLPGEIASKAQPDGYTLLVAGGSFWIEPLLQKTPYDPVRDFAPITLATLSPNILVVHPALAVTSVKELIALAKAKPGVLNFGSGGHGSNPHLSAELFKALTGINIVHIPYKGSSPALTDLIAGHVQLMFPNAASVTPHLKSGRLRALAVTNAQPSALLPNLPTVAAAGVPGYESGAMTGVFAPARTPAAIVNRLNQEMVRFLAAAETKEKLFSSGVEAVGSSPAQFAIAMKAEMARLGKVIKDSGIRAE